MEAMTVALTTATIFFPMTACARVTKSTEGKLRNQLWHVFLFSPWVRRTTLKSVYITTVFFFFETIFLGILAMY